MSARRIPPVDPVRDLQWRRAYEAGASLADIAIATQRWSAEAVRSGIVRAGGAIRTPGEARALAGQRAIATRKRYWRGA